MRPPLVLDPPRTVARPAVTRLRERFVLAFVPTLILLLAIPIWSRMERRASEEAAIARLRALAAAERAFLVSHGRLAAPRELGFEDVAPSREDGELAWCCVERRTFSVNLAGVVLVRSDR